mgnify:FL=1
MDLALHPGEVALVGGGPGDPDLLTRAAWRVLEQADVILHDRLGPVSVLDELPQGPELIPVGKVPRGRSTPQSRINELLVEHARAGRRVVRLKGGDAFVFGRGGEECLACAEAGVKVRVIPGVTSAVAVPELAGVPVTHRGVVQGFTVVSGHVPPSDERSTVDWRALARANTTLVLLMAVKYLPEIAEELMAGGLPPETPVAAVVEGSLPTQAEHRSTLAEVARLVERVAPPTVIVVGQVAGLELE